jgi:hypothetical protein
VVAVLEAAGRVDVVAAVTLPSSPRWTSATSPRSTTRGGERLGVQWSPCCCRRRCLARGERLEVAVTSPSAELLDVGRELAPVADAPGPGLDARLW